MSEHKADSGIQKVPTILFEIYREKRKMLLMYISIIGIESMVGTF